MSFATLSQWDFMELYPALVGDNPNLVVVKVGANDGIVSDPLATATVQNAGWTVLFIEPNPSSFGRLKQSLGWLPNARFAHVAVAPYEGTLTLYDVDPEAFPEVGAWIDVLTSSSKETVLGNCPQAEGHIRELQVPCKPLGAILAEHGIERPDVLQIDTEGMDWQVLQMVDLDVNWPSILTFEHHLISDEDYLKARELLERHHYAVIETEHDVLALRIKQ